MAAINPAVAAPYSMGVHRNTATKSHKAMPAANPAVKYGRAASILSTPTQTQSPLLRRNSVPSRSSDTRIMAANPEVLSSSSSSNLMGAQFVTQCQFLNLYGQDLKLEGHFYWHGLGDPPETIAQNQSGSEFLHSGDSVGSVGAVSYLVGDKVRWIIAWSNSGEDPLKLNKVYSEINEVSGGEIDWRSIKESLDPQVSKYTAINNKYGYSANLMIDPTSNGPTMTATFKW
ncbi:23 kDa jasmonate-induced protein-like protein [Gossypium australe]|uniref:23 kDa jasmonate-induced protein-like protein n=1 Tax=Gossypium australe TaxID=47621 RepID=A0A5B6WB14_9ROSI|nr:23 kDa jasmonate-induced protein-like protein [Gossypium australe]